MVGISEDPLIGGRVAGYRIDGFVGSGGMGRVYRATQLKLERTVALKLLAHDAVRDPEYRERFRRESLIAASVEHPNVIPVIEADEDGDLLFIAMRHVQGTDLGRELRSRGALPAPRAVDLARQVAAALTAAHARGLVHRDVKPGNILIAGDHVYLTDFGIAIRPGDATTAATMIGTLDYMAPEQCRGDAIDLRTDVYALGCVLYEMLTGEVPFVRPDATGRIAAHLYEEPPVPSRLRAGLPPELDEVIGKALAKRPEQRFASAADLADAAAAALGGTAAPGVRIAPSLLPRPATGFIGRERELGAVQALLADGEVRLLTLTGPGGTGKTRLALEAAARSEWRFADGARAVMLAGIAQPGLLTSAIAGALELRDAGDVPLERALRDHLRDRRVLLLCDNFEHLVDGATVLAGLLDAAPGLKVLATSRRALGLSAEHEHAVPPLDVPPVDGVRSGFLAGVDSVALFVERARAVDDRFALDDGNAAAVAEICRHLDGLPLAIELAAARVRLLPPEAIAGRLDRRFELLTSGRRDVPDRQRTLRATIDWSYELLAPREREMLARLGVFEGSFTIEGAEAVCGATIDDLAVLVDNSLLHRAAAGPEPRFALLETIRQYARERLGDRIGELRVAHAQHYAELAERAEGDLRGSDQEARLAALERDFGDIAGAIEWSLMNERPDLAQRPLVALALFWQVRHYEQGRRWLERALAMGGSPAELRAQMLLTLARVHYQREDAERVHRLIGEAIPLAEESGDARTLVRALPLLGWAEEVLGRPGRDLELAERALEVARGAGDDWLVAVALTNLSDTLLAGRLTARARGTLEEGLALSRAVGDLRLQGVALSLLGDILITQGEHAAAAPLFREAVGVADRLSYSLLTARAESRLGLLSALGRDWERAREHLARALLVLTEDAERQTLMAALIGCGLVLHADGDPVRAAVHWTLAERLRESVALLELPALAELYAPARADVLAALGEEGWRRAAEAAPALAEEELARIALDELAPGAQEATAAG